MRNAAISGGLLLCALLAFGPVALAQNPAAGQKPAPGQKPGLEIPTITPGPGWKTCPRCQNEGHVAEDRKKLNVDTHPFDAHDISGVWGDNGIALDRKARPPLTPYGQKLYDANKSDSPQWSTKDPLQKCDPMGYPRAFTYNYGMEFIQLPDRVLQFFEWGHTWRTIWTDGRKLPTDPPIYRYLGYAIGRWEGDTFVVESNGYDDRTWIVGDNGPGWSGFPHSTEMKIEERYKRLNYGLLQATLTITDPKVYTKPWTTTDKATLRPTAELWEYFCAPSDSENFNNGQTDASTIKK